MALFVLLVLIFEKKFIAENSKFSCEKYFPDGKSYFDIFRRKRSRDDPHKDPHEISFVRLF